MARLVWGAVAIGALAFALQAGEFSTLDIIRARTRRTMLQAQVDSLQKAVDSLKRVERMVRTDPVTQERIAREEFGMVRGDNEMLYRFVAPTADTDSARGRKQH